LEEKTMKRPSWLIIGRTFLTSTSILPTSVGETAAFFSALRVSVIWKMRRCA
jgi:hypothetical protein